VSEGDFLIAQSSRSWWSGSNQSHRLPEGEEDLLEFPLAELMKALLTLLFCLGNSAEPLQWVLYPPSSSGSRCFSESEAAGIKN